MGTQHVKRPFAAPILLVCVLMDLCSAALSDQKVRSPINGQLLKKAESNGSYVFLAAGHLYGAPANRDSTMPAATLLANLTRINRSEAEFFVALGDVFRRAQPDHIANFKDYFANQLRMPLFNAVGNHDVSNRALYEKAFGTTVNHFFFRTELFVLLDTEIDDARICGPQLEYLAELLGKATERIDLRSVFIFSHKLLWAADPKYSVVLEHVNSKQGYSSMEPFSKTLAPLIRSIAERRNVYWVSGDIGSGSSLPLFFERDESTGAVFIATGIGENERDVMLQFRVPADKDQQIEITPISLAGKNSTDIELYDRRYWESHYRTLASQRDAVSDGLFHGIVRRSSNLATSMKFWAGVAIGLAISFAIGLTLRRRCTT